ncbi:DUF928 domain-containing protein [Trichocoleus sp. FACHB-591]|uniref:DUF928 domain-containing protein n=1 Tax=Trichocoleus sp. FACHB-591 TaxID=2692872 RepID=UPI001687479A|nr:DUF928 domain-containing protein [Trichocoleus sp. FACHB-591]MBD2097704.1 DUF928 domain-containing protein [Trichocoleus sp. FACHB-591]
MTQHPRFKSHRFWTALSSTATFQRATVFVGVVLLSSFAIVPMVLAGYKPPRSSRPSGSTIATTVRGEGSCEAGTKGTLTALAPLSHIGQTTATHPTFAWYVPDNQSYSIEFTLYSRTSSGKPVLLYQTQFKSKKGIMQYSLPNSEAGLKVGQTYLWQVALLCNPDSPDKDQVLRTDVEVVAMPAALESSLAKTSDNSQRANLFAKFGFWYDAIAEALKDTKTKSVTISLLENLINVEATGTPDKVKQQHDRLQQVLNAEQQ